MPARPGRPRSASSRSSSPSGPGAATPPWYAEISTPGPIPTSCGCSPGGPPPPRPGSSSTTPGRSPATAPPGTPGPTPIRWPRWRCTRTGGWTTCCPPGPGAAAPGTRCGASGSASGPRVSHSSPTTTGSWPTCATKGELLRVGRQGAVRRDVAEDLVEHGQDVRVLDRVVGVAPLAPGRHDPGQPQLGQVLAGGGDAQPDPPGQGADVGRLVRHQPGQVQPGRAAEQGERRRGRTQLKLGRLGASRLRATRRGATRRGASQFCASRFGRVQHDPSLHHWYEVIRLTICLVICVINKMLARL